jgi:hypothetical protein
MTDADLMTDIKTRYENGFLTTEQGREFATRAKETQEVASADLMRFERDPSHGQTTSTKGVRRAYLPDVLDKAEIVRIVPIGLNNFCWQNATWLEDEFGFKKIYGFNIVACRCGGRMCFEIHAVNRNPLGELIDITRDYCGETEKWFVPFANNDFDEDRYRAVFQQKVVCFQPSCRCNGGKWNNDRFIWCETETRFEAVWKLINNQ